jgi:predicted permease
MVFPLPMDYETTSISVFVAGKTETPNHETEPVWSSRVDPGYFATMGTPIVSGREFTAQDEPQAPAVVIVNEAMAQRYWPGEDAIGREIRVGSRTGPARRVVGVAKNGKYMFLGDAPMPAMWTPLRQNYSSWVEVVVHAAGDANAVLPSVRAAIQRMDPNVAIFGAQTIDVYLKRVLNLAESEAYTAVTFGMMALILSALGIYGVISYSVVQRTREMGIRIALGARAEDVLRLMMRQAVRLCIAGVGIGTVIGLGLTQVMDSLLYGVSAHDPRVFVLTPLVLIAVALVAAAVPARRATRVDPLVALRCE